MWSELFDTDFPGVTTASLVDQYDQLIRTFPIQWWKGFYKQSEDFIDITREVYKVILKTDDAYDLDRNSILVINSVHYLVSPVNHDDHGITALYLELK